MTDRKPTMVEEAFDLLEAAEPGSTHPMPYGEWKERLSAFLARAKPYVDDVRSGALVPVEVEIGIDGIGEVYVAKSRMSWYNQCAVTRAIVYARRPQPQVVTTTESEPA